MRRRLDLSEPTSAVAGSPSQYGVNARLNVRMWHISAVRGSAAMRPESEVERTYHLPRSLHPDPGPGMTATANAKALGLTIPDKLIAPADEVT